MKKTARRGGTRRERRRCSAWATLAVAAVLALVLATTGLAASARTELVSVSPSGAPGNSDSLFTAVSADGRYVAFASAATNLVPGDTNRALDVFVRDRELDTTERVSVSSTGQQGNSHSFQPAISADGRYVAFTSAATNLVAWDTNRDNDVFVRDLKLGTTERLSVSSGGREGDENSQAPAISADGRYVAFTSKASNLVSHDNNLDDVFVRDRELDTTKRVSVSSTGEQSNSDSSQPAISADGRYVAFTSWASNLVAGDTNGVADVFVRDRERAQTTRVSVSSTGHQSRGGPNRSPAISANGRYVAFTSAATNLVAADTNGVGDVFVRDRERDKTRRVSVSSTGQPANGSSFHPAISAHGRYVVFASAATDLVVGGTNGARQAFLWDRKLGTTRRASFSSTGLPGNSNSDGPAISGDGRYVAFVSEPDGGRIGIFVRGPLH